MNKVLLSVVIPVYRSEAFIAACIESVLVQSFSNFELIVVDDGSDDASGSICDAIARRDDRITVIHQTNSGRSAARARGVAAAQGEWVTFVDSDDRLPSEALALLYAAATDETDIVMGNGYTLHLDPCPRRIEIEEFRHLAVRSEGTIGVPWGSLYRRTLLSEWLFDIPRHIINGEDYLFWLRLVFATEKPVHIVPESVYDKGDEHTCNSFVWTADYSQELDGLRRLSIPASRHSDFLDDMLSDRLTNMFSVAVCTPRREWQHSAFYRDIRADIKRLGRSLPLKKRLFFLLPCRSLRRLYSWLGERLH